MNLPARAIERRVRRPATGIAWFISLFRVLRALILAGGLAALGAIVFRNRM